MQEKENDFGFTFVHEDEIESEIETKAKAAAVQAKTLTVQEYKQKLHEVEAIIVPFLTNLMKDPDKVMIKWPNRKEIVEKQLNKILTITKDAV
jgi:hypothetical protein